MHLWQAQVGDVVGAAAGEHGPVARRQLVACPMGPALDARGPVGQRHLVHAVEQEADLAAGHGLAVRVGQAGRVPLSAQEGGGLLIAGELEQVGANGEFAVEWVAQPLAGQVERQAEQGGSLARARLAQDDQARLPEIGQRLAHVVDGHAGRAEALVAAVAETQRGVEQPAGQRQVVALPAGVGFTQDEAGQVDLLAALGAAAFLQRAEQGQVGGGEARFAIGLDDDDGLLRFSLHAHGGLRLAQERYDLAEQRLDPGEVGQVDLSADDDVTFGADVVQAVSLCHVYSSLAARAGAAAGGG